MYSDMTSILQEKQTGVAKLTKFTVEPGWASFISHVSPGNYIKLVVNGELMMSNTAMEKRTSACFVNGAEGDVLICGLGIGLVLMPLFTNPKVKSITVVEKYKDVIDIVLPQLKPYDVENKLKVIHSDCFDFTTEDKFDTIFIDIWPSINRDIY